MRRLLTLVSLTVALALLAAPAFAQTPPAALQAQTNGTGQITLTWTAVAGATQYYVYLGTQSGGPYTTRSYSTNATTTHLSIGGLSDTTTYYAIVKTVVNGTAGPASAQVSVCSGSAQLAAPANLTGTTASGQVALTWSSVPGATAYDVYRTPDAAGNQDGLLVSGLTGTAYTDSGVTNGTTYTYQVAAVCSTGEGTQCGPVAETPLSPPALSAEATASQQHTEIDLSWTASAGATSYTLNRSTASGSETAYQTIPNGTTYADTSVTVSTTYYYTVVAVAGTSSSSPSGEVSAKAGSTLLSAPTLTVNSANAQASLSWTSVSGATYYDVYRATGMGTPVFYAHVPSGTAYTDDNLSNGTTYVYQVAAGSVNGQGTLSNSVAVTPLAAPTISAATISSSEIDLSWTSSLGATAYHLDRSASSASGPWTLIASPSGTTDQDTGLTAGTNYWYHVQAVATRGSSNSSNSVLAETAAGTPTGLTATPGSSQVSLSWTAPAGDVGSYRVYRGISAGGESATPVATGITGTSYTDGSASNGTTYYYEVSAVDQGGEGGKSNEASARPPYGPPTLTTAASATPNPATGTRILLSALGTSPGGAANLTYTWSASPSAGVTFTLNGTSGASHPGAVFAQAGTYTFTVVIADRYGASVSSSVTVTVVQTPANIAVTPAALSLSIGGTQLFTATLLDQFGNVIPGQSFDWSVDNPNCSIDPMTGVFTAGFFAGTATVTATDGDVTGTASVTVTDIPPAVAVAASADPNPVTGTVTSLSVLGADVSGESTLRYTWSATGPGFVTYLDNGTNTAKNTMAAFTLPGAYTLTATIEDDSGNAATSSVTVTVNDTPTSVEIYQNPVSVSAGSGYPFLAYLQDQFGNPINGASFTWSVLSGTGTINSSGDFTAPTGAETDVVQATSGGVSGTATVNVTAQVGHLPLAPTGLSATAGVGQIVLTWSDSDTSVTSYNIYRSISPEEGSGAVVASVAGSSDSSISFTDNGLGTDQTYYYTVTAVNTVGESSFSNEASVILTDPFPGAPTGLAASPGNNLVILSWSTPEGPVTSYNVYRGTSAGGESNLAFATGLTVPGFVDTSAVDGTPYFYVVTAVNSGGESSKSNEASATPTNAAPTIAAPASASPIPVTGTTVGLSVLGGSAAGESTLTYSWSYIGPGSVMFSDSGTNSAKNVTATFTQAGTYVFTVTILDGTGQGATSSVGVQVDQMATSLAISPFNVALSIGASLQFSAVEQDQFGYALASQPTGLSWSVAAGTGSIDQAGHYTTPNAIELDTVQASLDGETATARVTVTSITGQGPTPPSIPTSLTAVASNNQVVLSWSDSDPGVSSYNIYRTSWAGEENGSPLANMGAGNEAGGAYTDSNLVDGDTYYYTVTAVGTGGESGFSDEASATPSDTPPVITVPAMASPATVTGTTVVLSVTATSPSGSPLFYSWAASGPAPVSFSTNNQIGADTTTANFIEAGSYIFTVTIVDASGEQITSEVDVNVIATLTQALVLPCIPAPYLDSCERVASSYGGSVWLQEVSTDQFGMVLGDNPQWTLTSGSGQLFYPTSSASTVDFDAPNIIAPETDTIQMTDGNITRTVSIGVTRQPLGGSGYWGGFSSYDEPQVDLPQYTYTGTATTSAGGASGMDPWQDDMQKVVNLPQGGSFSSSGSVTVTCTWIPQYPNSPSAISTYFVVTPSVSIYAFGGSEDGASPTVNVSDSFGDPEFDYSGLNPDLPGYDPTLGAECGGHHFVMVDSSSGKASMTTSQSDYLGIQSAGTITNNMSPPEVVPFMPGLTFNYLTSGIGAIASGTDFQFYIDIDGSTGNNSSFNVPLNLQSIILKPQAGGSSIMPTKLYPFYPGYEGNAIFDLGTLPPGIYTYVAEEAVSVGNDPPILIDSRPYTLGVGSCTVQSGSLSSNSVYAGDTITGQVSATMNPQDLDSGGTGLFVTHYYWTQQAYYSADGSSGSFEPYYGDYTVTMPQQEQATTNFIAVFNVPGFYILKFTCTAAVIDNASGQPGATFYQSCYVGNQSDIDPASQPHDGKMEPSSLRRAQRHTMSGSANGDISANALLDVYQIGNSKPLATYPLIQPTPKPVKVMVGQTIDLSPHNYPPGATFQWAIQGVPIIPFTYTSGGTQPHTLPQDFLTKSEVKFFWYTPGTYNVTLTAMDNKGVQTVTATFVVMSPTVNSFTSSQTSHNPSVFVGKGIAGFGLTFGDDGNVSKEYQGPGIYYSADVSVPSIGAGNIAFLQEATASDRSTTDSNGMVTKTSLPKDVSAVDNYNTEVLQKPTFISGGGEETTQYLDGPEVGLNPSLNEASAAEQYSVFLMYQPTGGSWVTISLLKWSWSGEAHRITSISDPPNGKWVLDSGHSYNDKNGASSVVLPSYTMALSQLKQ